jgi:hypothetical protein
VVEAPDPGPNARPPGPDLPEDRVPEDKGAAGAPTLNHRAEAAVERLKGILDEQAAARSPEDQAEIDQAREELHRTDGGQTDLPPEVGADLEAAGEDNVPKTYTDPETGKFIPGNRGGGRPPGNQNKFPDNYIRIMRDLIVGKIKELAEGEKDPVAIGKIIAQLYFDGLNGKVVLSGVR